MKFGQVQLNADITLRNMTYRPPSAKGTVLFLHGFPETLYVWKEIAEALCGDYEVHAFDWPGYGGSSRPRVGRFAYSPSDYAQVLIDYIDATGVDRSRLLIYATDIGSLPALLAALQEPDLARQLIVGDFAPFNRPQYMAETLQGLKARPTSDIVRAAMNKNRADILENAYRRGFAAAEQFDLAPHVKADMWQGWPTTGVTPADAFYHYYSHFTREQDYFEAHMALLSVPVKIIWGERDFYINQEMGVELARRNTLELTVYPGIGHYPHLQAPRLAVEEVRKALDIALATDDIES